MKRELKIEGMMCEHCVARVKKALEGVKGATNVEVSLANNNAFVEGDASNEELVKAVTDAGYKVLEVK